MEKRYQIRRVERICKYAGLVVAGVFLTISPAPLVRDQVSVHVQYTFSACLTASALMCLWGSWTDRWIGEYGGIFLLTSTMWFYGGTAALAWWPYRDDKNALYLAGFSLILISFGFSLLARWKDVRRVKLQASEVYPKHEE